MRKWQIAEKNYEGFPLFLRRPVDLETTSLQPTLPVLAIITHSFAKRKPNGLPDDDYNHGLGEMDQALVTAFDVDRMGVPVLVETFGGKRNYYFYVAKNANVGGAVAPIANRYPSEHISWSVRSDPKWSFIEKYSSEHF